MVVAIRTGLRVGEMVALRWREDIDLERGRLRVQQSYSRKNGFTTPKNDKPPEAAPAGASGQREPAGSSGTSDQK